MTESIITATEGIATELRRILRSIAPEADLSDLAPNADLREALDLDSMDFLRFATAMSERFGVEVPEADYLEISTFEGATRYVERRAGGS
jgi:acyl carrier protein